MSRPIATPCVYAVDLNELIGSDTVYTLAGLDGYSPWIPSVGDVVIAEDDEVAQWDALVESVDGRLIELRLLAQRPTVRVEWGTR